MSNHYNPDWLSDEALLAGFVARQGEFNFLQSELAGLPLTGSTQHYLLVGVRGAGKTTLLKRLAVAIRQNKDLSNHLIALSFPEELYQVKDLNDFWWASCEALSDALDRLEKTQLADDLLVKIDAAKATDANAGFALLQSTCKALKLRPVLLVDNLDMVFQRIDKSGRKLKDPHAAAYWALRDQLSSADSPIVIGGSVRLSDAFTGYDHAFYDFFIPKRLSKLSLKEVRDVLTQLADAQSEPAVKTRLDERPHRLETLYELTGGNPRAIGLIFQLLKQSPSGRAIDDFERLMDITTPYYKARFEDLSEQSQVVMHALAVRRPVDAKGSSLRFGHTAAEIGVHTSLPTTTVSAQLDNMDKEGLIEKNSHHGRVQYRIAEQLFRLWLQMRGSRRIRQNVLGLAEFLEAMYSVEELKRNLDAKGEKGLADAKYAMAISGMEHAGSIRKALEASAIEGVMEHLNIYSGDLGTFINGEDISSKDLKSLMDMHEKLRKCKNHTLIDSEKEALLGSVKLTIEKKAALVTALCEQTTSIKAITLVKNHLIKEQRELLRYGLLATDLPLFYHARTMACLPLPHFTPDDVQSLEIALRGKSIEFIHSLVWRVMGLRRLIKIEGEAVALAWLAWGERFATKATSTEWANVSGTMRVSGERNAAQIILTKAIEIGESARVWAEKATYVSPSDAEDCYIKALEIDPLDAFIWNNYGKLLHDLEAYPESEDAYRKAIKLDDAGHIIWNNFGKLLHDIGKYDEAESAYRKATEIEDSYSYAWTNLGHLMQTTFRIKESIQAYKKAANLDPHWDSYWQSKLCDVQTQFFVEKFKLALIQNQSPTLRNLLLELQKDVSDLTQVFADKHFVEGFLAIVLKQKHQATFVLDVLREMNADRFARPLLIAFEAAIEGKAANLDELEPELQHAAKRMYERLTAKPV